MIMIQIIKPCYWAYRQIKRGFGFYTEENHFTKVVAITILSEHLFDLGLGNGLRTTFDR